MSEGEPVRSVLFSLDLAEAEVRVVASMLDQIQVQGTEIRLGKWKPPLYICATAVGCSYEPVCPHAKPHKEKVSCRRQWGNILGLRNDREGQFLLDAPQTTQEEVTLDFIQDVVDLYGVYDEAILLWHRTHYASQVDAEYLKRYRSKTGHWCNNCIAIPDSRKFVPMAKARLSNSTGKVICPSAIESCVGRCHHAMAHDKSKFCKDLFPNTEASLQCRPVNTKKLKRGLLFDTPLHACQI